MPKVSGFFLPTLVFQVGLNLVGDHSRGGGGMALQQEIAVDLIVNPCRPVLSACRRRFREVLDELLRALESAGSFGQ